MGIVNATTIGTAADVMLVSDTSGSMEFCSQATSWSWNGWNFDNTKGCVYWFGWWLWESYSGSPAGYVESTRTTWNDGTNNLCGCRWHPQCGSDASKLSLYKNAGKQFIDILINISGNRAGLDDISATNDKTVYINS